MCVIYFKIPKKRKRKSMICPFHTSFPIDESNVVVRETSMHTIASVCVNCSVLLSFVCQSQTSNAPKHFGCLHGVGALYSLWLSLSSHAVCMMTFGCMSLRLSRIRDAKWLRTFVHSYEVHSYRRVAHAAHTFIWIATHSCARVFAEPSRCQKTYTR